MKPQGMLTAAQAAKVLALRLSSPSFTAMRRLAMRFRGILRSGKLDKLDQWLHEVHRCGLQAIQRFARTVSHDLAAVRNASTERWNNGPVDGQINRLKALKRAMYGRAGLELLRARLMPFS
jgi:transposase